MTSKINLDPIKINFSTAEDALVQQVILAGEILKEYQLKLSNLKVDQKNDGTVVSEADLAVNDFLMQKLRDLFPEDQICSEEVPVDHFTHQQTFWYLDPLDGTKNFVSGENDYAILIAKVQNSVPVFSIVYFPELGELLVAKDNQGAYSNIHGKLQVSENTEYNAAFATFRKFPVNADVLGNIQEGLHTGAGQKLLLEGKLDVCGYYLDYTGAPHAWDFAPFMLMIKESGGVCTDEQGADIKLNLAKIDNKSFVASNGHIHQQILDLLKTDV